MTTYTSSTRFSWPSVLVGALGVLLALSAVIAWAVFAHADTGPTVTATILNNSNATTTTAAVGSQVHVFAQVASTTGSTTPSGTVTFNRFANTSCSGNPATETDTLLNGAASSSATTVPNTGLSFIAHYDGDINYPAAQSACVVVAATAPSTTLSTALATSSVLAGTSVTDSATLGSSTASASGTVTYTVYTNNSCTANPTSAGSVSVSNGSVPNSSSVLFNTPGTYYWQAVYSGDSSNAAATSTCGSEVLTVNSTSTAPTTGKITIDEVTNPSGDPTSFSFNATGTGYSNFSLTDQAAPNMQTLNPGTYAVSQNVPAGWNLSSVNCARNGGSFGAYTPGSSITLNAGDTISCTFVDTQIGTSTQDHHHRFCDSDGDEEEFCSISTSTATSTPSDEDDDFFGNGFPFDDHFPFGILKHFFGGPHDNGNHNGEIKNGNNGKGHDKDDHEDSGGNGDD